MLWAAGKGLQRVQFLRLRAVLIWKANRREKVEIGEGYLALQRGMAVSELGSYSWHLQGMWAGYKRVSVLLNCMILVPLLQPWVSFSIPSVNIPSCQQGLLPGSGVRARSVVVLSVDVAQGKYFIHSLAPGCLASSLFCKHCIYG